MLEHAYDLEQAHVTIEEVYCGCYTSVGKFIQEWIEETTVIPKRLQHYIDYEAMGRYMELGHAIYTIEIADGAVHVFWTH